MINLLKPETKLKLKQEQNKLKLLVVLSGILVWLMVLNFLNLGLWVFFRWPVDIISSSSITITKDGVNSADLEKVLCLAEWWPHNLWFESLVKLDEERSSLVSVKQLSGVWDTKKNERTLTWRGQASKKEELVSLADKLRTQGYFAEVNLPFDSLVATGDFSLILKLKKK